MLGCSSVMETLPNMLKSLTSIPDTVKSFSCQQSPPQNYPKRPSLSPSLYPLLVCDLWITWWITAHLWRHPPGMSSSRLSLSLLFLFPQAKPGSLACSSLSLGHSFAILCHLSGFSLRSSDSLVHWVPWGVLASFNLASLVYGWYPTGVGLNEEGSCSRSLR